MREVEAKVGPIKYIAQLIYGDNPDENLLEKAVTWVIITIVFVFDPLAVLLLLASQMSFQWARQEKERNDELVQEKTPPEDTREEVPLSPQPVVGTADQGSGGQPQPDTELSSGDHVTEEANRKIAEIEQEIIEPVIPEESKKDPLTEWNEMIAEAEKAVEEESDDEILAQAPPTEKDAMHAWKAENPDGCLKYQRKLLDRGVITELPWMKYLEPEADFDDEAAVEAAKWAREQQEKIEESKKKNLVSWMEREGDHQIKKSKEV
jgi:hypothetical protein